MTEKATGDIRVIELSGSPLEIGRAHDETLRSEIADIVGRWKANLEETSGIPADRYLDQFGRDTNFTPAIERTTPGLLEEIRGLAEGSGISFRNIISFQLIDEQWIYTRQLREHAAPAAHHCTALGVFDPGRPPILAQNMDIPKYFDGSQILLRLSEAESGVTSLILRLPG